MSNQLKSNGSELYLAVQQYLKKTFITHYVKGQQSHLPWLPGCVFLLSFWPVTHHPTSGRWRGTCSL
jgi:hypothetical protein